MKFSVSGLDYDDNGNIRKMDQQGWKLSGSTFIDKLRYNYQANSNKLLNVIDSVQDAATKLGDFRTSSNHPNVSNKTASTVDYLYDGNGNMRRDYNKDLGNATTDGIIYNHLNLPQQVTVKVPSGGSGGNKGIITYTYDASGTKLQKQVVDYSEPGRTITTTTKYIGGTVYESRTITPADPLRKDYTDLLQFITHEEGRIRYLAQDSSRCPIPPNRLYYDYYLKDHLGNVRMVLTEQSETQCYVPATVEDGSWATESLIYNIVDTRRVLKTSVGASAIGSFGQKVYRTNGGVTAEKTGLGVMLKVMQGDTVRMSVESFYTLPGGGNVGAPLVMGVMDLIGALTTATGFPVSKGLTSTHINAISGNPTNLNNYINNRTTPVTQARAALNWILFDDQFHYVSGGFELVNNNGGYKLHNQFINNPLTASKNGFLYIYVSNESNLQVFFDNLLVSHTNGPIQEETHYYPFGLTMAGLSSKALNGTAENKYKYNGIEQNSDFDLNMYDAFYRNLDPQIGRFWQVDPYTEELESYSPYESMGNNPVNNVDPLGDFKTWFGAFFHKIFNGGGDVGKNKFGEWFVRKTETSYSEEGGPTVTATVTYGNGRNRSSEAREEAVSDMRVATDIYIHAENSMYQMYASPEEAGKGALSIGTGVVLLEPILKNTTSAFNLAKLKAQISKLMRAARVVDKNGLSRIGRALNKHGGRAGSVYPKASGNPEAINKQGEAVLKEILSSPEVEVVTRHHARFGNVSEYKLPNGQGARFSADGKKFIGFINKGQ